MQSHNAKGKSDLRYRTYNLSISIIKFVDRISSSRSSKITSDQLLRSATSIGANIIEAQAASSKKDFINFYNIALKSANETKYWLGLIRDTADTDKNEVQALLEETAEIANILGASILTMRNKR